MQDTGTGGAKGQITIHYKSGVDFTCQFDSTASSPTFSSSTSGSNPYNYIVERYGPVIVGNAAKVTLSIADPKLKKWKFEWRVARGTITTNDSNKILIFFGITVLYLIYRP